MNRDIQLHDSTISAITQCDGSVTIFLSDAEIHESPGLPACDPGLLWTQDALIVIHGAEPFTFEAPLPIWITDGTISSGQVFHNGFIPATGRFEGPSELILTLSTKDRTDGGTLTVKGTRVTIKLKGDRPILSISTKPLAVRPLRSRPESLRKMRVFFAL